jgi:hypothetical protein
MKGELASRCFGVGVDGVTLGKYIARHILGTTTGTAKGRPSFVDSISQNKSLYPSVYGITFIQAVGKIASGNIISCRNEFFRKTSLV